MKQKPDQNKSSSGNRNEQKERSRSYQFKVIDGNGVAHFFETKEELLSWIADWREGESK